MDELPTHSGQAPAIDKEERTWAMACHLSAVSGFFTGGLGAIIGPLVIWLIKKEDMPFVDEQGKEALNFQITMLLAGLVSVFLMLVVIGFLLIVVVILLDLIFTLIAAVRANDGVHYRYPISIRLIS